MPRTQPTKQTHPFGAVFDSRSRVLVLGSFPSVSSREAGFYYGNPRNRFWPLLAAVFGREPPRDNGERRALLLDCGVALWDVAAECEISRSSDASIRRASANDISSVLDACEISEIIANGATAARLYRALCEPTLARPITQLPSTSPANAAWSFERLCGAWRKHLAR